MVAGHLRIKDGNYHIVLSYNDENGKRKSTCRSTHLPVRGNKKRAEAMLQEAISTLPDVQRAVFNLRYFDDMKYSEISEILQTSEGSLKASYHIAVKKISDFFKRRD